MAKKEPAKSRAAKTAARRRSARIHPPLPGQMTLADFTMDKKGASGASASAILHVAEPARQELLAGEELTGDEKQQINDYEKQQIENAATTTNKETSAEPDPKCDEELASMPRRCLQVTQSPLRPSLPKAATVAQPAQSKVVAQIVLPWPSNTLALRMIRSHCMVVTYCCFFAKRYCALASLVMALTAGDNTTDSTIVTPKAIPLTISAVATP